METARTCVIEALVWGGGGGDKVAGAGLEAADAGEWCQAICVAAREKNEDDGGLAEEEE